MTFRRWATRAIYSASGAILFLTLLIFVALQFQQRTLRWRAEHLSAEMHQVRLYQSTWSDAQRLMQRWGAWGHYDGSCTATNCKYEIDMTTIGFYHPHIPRHAWLDWMLMHDRLNLYTWLGGRDAAYKASFTVHNGTIWRVGQAIGVVVSHRKMRRENDFDLTLSLGAGTYQRLRRTISDPFTYMGGAEELVGHPYYKLGGPSGCKPNCEILIVYFSTRTPPAEIQRFTSYEFSCFTRFNPCATLEELLPAAREWHLHPESEPAEVAARNAMEKEWSEESCSVPVWALARDARYVLAVEALSSVKEKLEQEQGWFQEATQVRVDASLKEPVPWAFGALVMAHPYGRFQVQPSPQAEHMIPGKRYIVFPIGNDRRDQRLTRYSSIELERCGVQEDTPEIRKQLEIGFAQNDNLNP
jgi:hypothetical protein